MVSAGFGPAKLRAMSNAPSHSDLLADLTEPQRQAVLHVDGPLLVLAGAGSGKTRVITRRIANLILNVGIPPWQVLAITFTNKAAGEMRQRIAKVVSERQARAVTAATFHSLCARLLRDYSKFVDLPSNFSIYDSADQQRAIKQALSDLKLSADHFAPQAVLGQISDAKSSLIGVEAFSKSATDFFTRTVARVYEKYQKTLRHNNAIDFDDLLLMTANLMRKNADVLAALQERFQYILIDEYQDTNHAQFVIASALAAKYKNICATGDPDQSIYGWRGANLNNILDFETHYPNATVVRLEQNYRSTKNILAVADALISHNVKRKHKKLWTENDAGEKVQIVRTDDERDEAQWIVGFLQQANRVNNIPWHGMAVFYRVNSLSRVIEDALRAAGIPYQIVRGTAFFDRKEVKDAVAYLRVLANPSDEVNLERIINTPTRGISDATVAAMQAHAVATQSPLIEVIRHPAQIHSLNTRAVAAVDRFAKLFDKWQIDAGLVEPTSVTQAIAPSLRRLVESVLMESGLHEFYKNDKTDTEGERFRNLGELLSSAQQFEDDLLADNDGNDLPVYDKLLRYLERISLVSDTDTNPENGSVTLMTLHAAKGLEFPVVAMLGLEDGLLPHSRARDNRDEMEEERRLCFVGITRAQQLLALTYTRGRTVFGRFTPTIASPFLRELPRGQTDAREEVDRNAFPGADASRYSQIQEARQAAEEDACEFPPGTLVRHKVFGVGRVLQVNLAGAQTRARISFDRSGVKTVVLQYANLERVDP